MKKPSETLTRHLFMELPSLIENTQGVYGHLQLVLEFFHLVLVFVVLCFILIVSFESGFVRLYLQP